MSFPKTFQLQQIHRAIAPILALPLLVTAITGSIYQITDLSGYEVKWLLELHKGNIGFVHLEAIYPFLNALGLIALLATGISIWLQQRSHPTKRKST